MEIKNVTSTPAANNTHLRNQRWRLAAILSVLCLAISSQAQELHRFTADFGAGVTPLGGKLSDRLNTGWNIGGSAGINFNRFFSTSLRFNYNRLGVNSALLQLVGTPDGHANLWSISLDPKVQLGTYGRLRPYAVGGVGYYRRTVDFTRPVFVRSLFFDPFFGFFAPSIIEEDVTVKQVTKDGVGGSLGAGFDVPVGNSGLKLFTEARYEYADTGNIPTRIIPVKFGVRW